MLGTVLLIGLVGWDKNRTVNRRHCILAGNEYGLAIGAFWY